MDSTIVAALIGGAAALAGAVGTLVGTVIGGRQSAKTATTILQHQFAEQRAADRERRTWEARIAAYADCLAFVDHQAIVINHRSRNFRLGDAEEQNLVLRIREAKPEKSFVVIQSTFKLVASAPALAAFVGLEKAWDQLYTAETIRGSLQPGTGQIGAVNTAELAVEQARQQVAAASEQFESVLRVEIANRPPAEIALPAPRKPILARMRARLTR